MYLELPVKKTSPTAIDAAPKDSTSDLLLLDRAAADRALDFYLSDTAQLHLSASAITTLKDSVNLQAALGCASDLLHCAGRSANEVSNALSGVQRDHALLLINMVETARQYIESSLDGLKSSWESAPKRANQQTP